MLRETRGGATGYRVYGDALALPVNARSAIRLVVDFFGPTITSPSLAVDHGRRTVRATTGEVSSMLLDIRILMVLGVIMALVLMSSAEGADAIFPYLTDLEAEVVEEMNVARSEPGRYAQFLEERRQYYRGRRFERPGQVAIITNEGVSAVDEAIDFLRRVEPVGALRPSQGMSRAAKDHVRDQGPSGALGIEATKGVGCPKG